MNDNEQRAHDLTLASLPLLTQDKNFLKENDQNFDVYLIYKSVYAEMLKLMNRDFPLEG